MASLPPSSPGFRRYNYVLAPESSEEESDSDKTVSVYSMQDRETEYIRDESDTCTKSDVSEYTVLSLPSEKDAHPIIQTSSSEDFDMKTKMIVVETYLNTKSSKGNSTLGSGNGDDEYDSTQGSVNGDTEFNLGQANYRYCAWCNRLNVPPTKYRYCSKCFLMRRDFFPQKPKATKKRPKTKVRTNNNHALCANVPTCKKQKRHSSSESESNNQQAKSMKLDTFIDKFGNMKANSQIFSNIYTADDEKPACKKRKRHSSSESEGEQQASKKSKKDSESTSQSLVNSMSQSLESTSSTTTTKSTVFSSKSTSTVIFRDVCVSVDKLYEKALEEYAISGAGGSTSDQVDSQAPSTANLTTEPAATNSSDDMYRSELCIICDKNPKNGVFIHMSVVHACCCYHCGVKVWKRTKKCPTCTMPACRVLQLVVS